MGVQIPRRFLLISVLLVAPSASLAGPVLPTSPSSSAEATSPTTTVAPGDVGGGGGGGGVSTTTAVPQALADAASQHPVVIPWGQGVAVGGSSGQLPQGGFIYCAGCSPLTPGQLVIPNNMQWNQAMSASGVIPPQVAQQQQQQGGYTIEQQLNGIGGGGRGGDVVEEPGKGQQIWDDGSVPVQQMALHDDGRYSFSYNTAHASRQEERNFEGGVSGSYSYTDPDGKHVQIVYTAGPEGYQAYGDNVPPQPVLQLPQPVQDTLEVQMARQQFLDTYNRELERIQRAQEEAAARAATSTVAPEGVEVASPSNEDSEGAASEVSGSSGETQDDAVIVSGKTEGEDENADAAEGNDGPVPLPPAPVVEGGVTTDEQADSIVISAKGSDGQQQNDDVLQPLDVRSNLPDPSYQITIPIGIEGNQGLSVQGGARVQEEAGNSNLIGQGQQGQQQNVGAKSNLQPYFYYVSVGGQPHYVTSNSAGYNSPYPTSLKATLLGAMPLAAVHDAQVPNRAGQQQNSATTASRPVFLDLENGLKLDQQSQQGQQQQQAGQAATIINPASLFTLNTNTNSQSPLLGQLVPLGLSPGNTATFGYIPALILNNNNNNNNGQAQQSSQGSQSLQQQLLNLVPLVQQPQQQQQVSSVPSLGNSNNQPVIFLASKK